MATLMVTIISHYLIQEEQVRPDEEEGKKVAALEQLLRDIEAVLK